MSDEQNPIPKLLKDDPRYCLEAYQFVRDGLQFAQEHLNMGSDQPPVDAEGDEVEKHLTGQQLCEAIRQYAIEQYGLMAQTVLKNWGITQTGDFGNIVYNLIDVKLMKKSKHDRREDFDDVYAFDKAFREDFKIAPPDPF
ncbi:MAG: Minf_1886 family protein [Planctomycetota bacterium]